MKFWSTALTVTLGVDLERHPRAPTREIGFLAADKRHAQLTEMFTAYNPMFNDRQYFAYGCNCLLLGDRPITDPSLGPPVDELDSTCKQYKDCNKCVREQFGEQCVSEFRSYNFISGVSKKGFLTLSSSCYQYTRVVTYCSCPILSCPKKSQQINQTTKVQLL